MLKLLCIWLIPNLHDYSSLFILRIESYKFNYSFARRLSCWSVGLLFFLKRSFVQLGHSQSSESWCRVFKINWKFVKNIFKICKKCVQVGKKCGKISKDCLSSNHLYAFLQTLLKICFISKNWLVILKLLFYVNTQFQGKFTNK